MKTLTIIGLELSKAAIDAIFVVGIVFIVILPTYYKYNFLYTALMTVLIIVFRAAAHAVANFLAGAYKDNSE